MLVGKELQDRLAVVADANQSDSFFFELLFRVLQLDQLRFAEGSPIGRPEEPEEEDHQPVGTLKVTEVSFFAKLIGEVLPILQTEIQSS